MITARAKGIRRGESLELFGGRIRLGIGELLQRAHAKPADIVVVSGTIVEGIGSALSDLDVYVIADKKPDLERAHSGEHDWLNPYSANLPHVKTQPSRGKCLEEIFDFGGPANLAWNVEYRTTEEVTGLIRYVSDQYAEAMTHCRRLNHTFLAYKEKTLVHRLYTGIPIQGHEAYRVLCPDGIQEKFCVLNFREWIGGYPEFRDVMGAWANDDLETAFLILTNHLTDQLFALTFLEKDSNPNKKWLIAKLRRMSPPISTLADQFLEFLRLPDGNKGEQRAHLLDGLDLLDHIYDLSRDNIGQNPIFGRLADMLNFSQKDFAQMSARRKTVHAEMRRQWAYKERQFCPALTSVRELFLQGVSEANTIAVTAE